MQDAWAIRNKRDIIIDSNNQGMKKNTDKIVDLQDRLKAGNVATNPEKDEVINNIQTRISKLQSDIEMLQQDNESIRENGTSKRIMGEHHRTRLEQEAKAKAEQEAKEKAEQEAKIKLNSNPEIIEEDKNTKMQNEYTSKDKIQQTWDNIPNLLEYEEPIVRGTNSGDINAIKQALNKGITQKQYKTYQQASKPEFYDLTSVKYRTENESIKDEVGDEFNRTERNNNINNTQPVDLWMNRFNNWYNVIMNTSKCKN